MERNPKLAKYRTMQVRVLVVSDADELRWFLILLSVENDGGTKRATNPDSLRSCLFFLVDFCFLFLYFAACQIPPSRDNYQEVSDPKTQQ